MLDQQALLLPLNFSAPRGAWKVSGQADPRFALSSSLSLGSQGNEQKNKGTDRKESPVSALSLLSSVPSGHARARATVRREQPPSHGRGRSAPSLFICFLHFRPRDREGADSSSAHDKRLRRWPAFDARRGAAAVCLGYVAALCNGGPSEQRTAYEALSRRSHKRREEKRRAKIRRLRSPTFATASQPRGSDVAPRGEKIVA